MNLWCAEWHSKNNLDGDSRYLAYIKWQTGEFALFRTRQKCRDYINEQWGYIREREDLRQEPHGWRIPQAVKVDIVKVFPDSKEGKG